MSSNPPKHRWNIHIKNMETTIGVGIHPHEQIKQRVFVNVVVEGEYPAKPQMIEDCFNYDYVHELVVNEWPKREHKLLLENCATELLEHIFRCDGRVDRVSVRVCKPDIFPQVESVGVETSWTRSDFKKLALVK